MPPKTSTPLEYALVEYTFAEPASPDAVAQAERAVDTCLCLNRVRFVQRFTSLDGLRMLGVFQAPDAESVRRALERAPLPSLASLRVWTGRVDAAKYKSTDPLQFHARSNAASND